MRRLSLESTKHLSEAPGFGSEDSSGILGKEAVYLEMGDQSIFFYLWCLFLRTWGWSWQMSFHLFLILHSFLACSSSLILLFSFSPTPSSHLIPLISLEVVKLTPVASTLLIYTLSHLIFIHYLSLIPSTYHSTFLSFTVLDKGTISVIYTYVHFNHLFFVLLRHFSSNSFQWLGSFIFVFHSTPI